MTRKLRKAEIFTLRLTREQLGDLKRLAKQQGKKPSEMVRDLVLREIAQQAVAA
jgi:hypothetical protein